jgi:hypothetical protein
VAADLRERPAGNAAQPCLVSEAAQCERPDHASLSEAILETSAEKPLADSADPLGYDRRLFGPGLQRGRKRNIHCSHRQKLVLS